MEELREHLEQVLLANLRRDAPQLRALHDRVSRWNVYDHGVYKFYSESFKVYYLQEATEQIVAALAAIAPDGRTVHPIFTEIVRAGTGREFTKDDNDHWMERTAPIVQAFLHAKFFLEMALKCAGSPDPQRSIGSGWQALTELYCVYYSDFVLAVRSSESLNLQRRAGPSLRVWLDDEPDAPARSALFPAADGWVHCRWPEQVIEHLKTGGVAEISLDHDLGDAADPISTKQRSGYDVVAWLEQEVGCGRWSHPLPSIRVHSRNPVGRSKIEACVRNIQRLWDQNQPG